MDIHASRKAVQELNSLYTDLREGKKKDDTYLEPDMKKRQANNEKARKELAKGPQMKNPHFEEKGWDSVKSFAGAYKAVHEGIRDEDPEKGTKERKARLEKKRGMKLDDHPQYKKEEVESVDEANMTPEQLKKINDRIAKQGIQYPTGKKQKTSVTKKPDAFGGRFRKESLDPVGKEDKDIDNDGDVDSSDKYLHKRRKAISKAIKDKKLKEQEERIGGKTLKGMASKATKRIDADVDGDVDKKDKGDGEMGEFVPTPGKKFKTKIGESFSNWREDLVEVIDKDEQEKQIKEKNVKNKVVIDPELKLEQVAEELGGELLEWIELDEETYEMVKEAVYGGTPEKKKDTRMTVTAADKKANTPAYQKFKAGDKRYKAADHMGEGLSIDQQMKISRDHNRKSPEEKKAANMKALGTIKKVAAKKDTRTDAQKMTDATGPRPGSRYRGD